ncbi:sensor histidine kinase [Xanthobacter sp. ZOL 2024]
MAFMDWVKAQAVRTRHRERSALFAAAASRPRTLLDSVRRRLILMVLLALAPIAALNFIQGVMQLNAAEEEARQRLLQHATAAAADQEAVIASAENVLQALKNVADVVTGAPSCPAILHGAVLSLPFASNISVIDTTGKVTCAALPLEQTDVSDAPWWRAAADARMFRLSGRIASPTAHDGILMALLPLTGADGQVDGTIAMGIDIAWLDNLMKREAPPARSMVALFSPHGEELVSNARTASAALFAGQDMTRTGRSLREARDSDGRSWTFATAPLSRQGLTIAFALPTESLFRWTVLTVAASFALPALIVVASLVGLWLAVDRIVLRWVLYLRRVTAVYAQGHYAFRPTRINDAPSEFRALGHAVENMAFAVRERDARLRESLAEKTALVREIHHRIKNSLQIVVSLISLYGSAIPRGADRRRFEQLRTRVNTLALVHRILYEATEGSQVRLRELMGELAGLLESAAEGPLRISVEAEDAPLPTDMAVPLALMLVEIVLRFAMADGDDTRDRAALALTLSGSVADNRLQVAVEAPVDGPPPAATGADLAYGFAAQLGGTLEQRTSGPRVTVCGTFPCRDGSR